jgi:nitrate reductase cytochrome c-type subunit
MVFENRRRIKLQIKKSCTANNRQRQSEKNDYQPPTSPHGVTTQKITVDIFVAVSNYPNAQDEILL